jgi:Protein of unknown function (DUF1778)
MNPMRPHDREMLNDAKTTQLQIRVSKRQKSAIQGAAKRAGLDMSTYVLSRLISAPAARFEELIRAAAGPAPSFALAELNSFLAKLSGGELREAVAAWPSIALTPSIANYVAAMVEYACGQRSVAAPAWTRLIEPLADPMFATTLQSLRLHLLIRSPAPFRRRNIFIDSTLGARI